MMSGGKPERWLVSSFPLLPFPSFGCTPLFFLLSPFLCLLFGDLGHPFSIYTPADHRTTCTAPRTSTSPRYPP